MMYKFFTKEIHITLLIIFAAAAFFLYAIPIYQTRPEDTVRIFNSPDETANYFFAQRFSQTSQLSYPSPLNRKYGFTFFPRAVSVLPNGDLAPGSFLGMILLYGFIAKIFGTGMIVYLTPLFSLAGVIFFYLLIREIFSKNIAFLSSLLLLILPPWWYYNTRSMFHNVLFLNMVFAALYYFVQFAKEKKKVFFVASFIFFFLAFFIRSSELFWMLPLFVALFLSQKKQFSLKEQWILFITGGILVFMIAGIYYGIYENPLPQGYLSRLQGNRISPLIAFLFPFGFHPRQAWIHFFDYYPLFFWWYFLPFVGGVLFSFFSWNNIVTPQRVYFFAFLSVSLLMILYYGSWNISDNLDPQKVTLGTSYVRYWLPIYVFSLPYAALFFLSFASLLKRKWLRYAFSLVFVIIFFLFSFHITWFATEESIAPMRTRIQEYYAKRERVSQSVPRHSVIISERSDKIFFPVFPVMVDMSHPSVMESTVKLLVDHYPVYYYTFLNDHDIVSLQKRLKEKGLQLKSEKMIFGNERLFEVSLLSQDAP